MFDGYGLVVCCRMFIIIVFQWLEYICPLPVAGPVHLLRLRYYAVTYCYIITNLAFDQALYKLLLEPSALDTSCRLFYFFYRHGVENLSGFSYFIFAAVQDENVFIGFKRRFVFDHVILGDTHAVQRSAQGR